MSELRWTKEIPTEPGWYWYRCGPKPVYPPTMLEVCKLKGWNNLVTADEWEDIKDYDGEWAGPIPLPAD